MKKKYMVILLLLIWTAIMLTKPIIESLPSSEEKEDRAHRHKMAEERRAVRGQFDDVVTYCKEHEEDFMKVSEMFLEEFYADITLEELIEIVQNNTLPEWMELSKTVSVNCFQDYINVNEGIFYHYNEGGGSSLGVLYIDADHMDADEIDYHTNPSRDTFLNEIYKVNDYLYVCIYQFPYT